MKNLNLTKVALTILVAGQLLSVDAFAGSKLNADLLNFKKDSLIDPYFQISKPSVSEMTDEEAMEFLNEMDSTSNDKVLTIPPRPPEAGKLNPGNISAAQDEDEFIDDDEDEAVDTLGISKKVKPSTNSMGTASSIIMVVDKLIAIGQKIIPTIEKGKAVVTNSSMSAVSVLPRISGSDPVVHDMGNWSLPTTKHYKVAYNNGFGTQIVSFVYSVTYQHSGTYGGKGKYLTGIRASARKIQVSWGFDLDAKSQLIQISNIGTSKNVIAAATIEMLYTVKNWKKTDTNVVSFFVTGNNKLYKLD